MKKQLIKIISVINQIEGTQQAYNLVKNNLNSQTVVWLSGGSSPNQLYQQLAKDHFFHPAAAALVDERYGKKMHQDSNELMIEQTGLIKSLNAKNIKFYPILDSKFQILNSHNLKQVAKPYNQAVQGLINQYENHILIMGLGTDGHTAGIFADLPDRHPEFSSGSNQVASQTLSQDQGDKKYVTGYHTKFNQFRDRITLTPYALLKLAQKNSTFIILAFGDNKKEAIHKMLQDDKNIPANIYCQIANRDNSQVCMISDQNINIPK